MIGRLLKELVVKTGQYVRYRTSLAFQGAKVADLQATTSPPQPEIQKTHLSSNTDTLIGLKLDLGCGMGKRPGFIGIDRRQFQGVDGVTDLTKRRWLFERPVLGGISLNAANLDGRSGFILPDNSVAEVHCSHFLEHLEHNQAKPERVRFMNELWRVLVPGGKATIITPHWASNRAYGDFTHADKPVSEMFYYYLDRDWRAINAPDNDIEFNPDGYSCDFSSELGHSVHPVVMDKGREEVSYAICWYKEAIMDLFATLAAKK
jgi:SAM-dependent methyltransferase